jgi:putative membrane protein
MKWPALIAAAGIILAAGLLAHFGAGAVIGSLAAIGWAGFAAVTAMHLALLAAMGAAWWALLPSTRLRTAVWGRLVRDSASEILPLTQLGGYVSGARALALGGVPGTAAAASTIVDVSLEFIAQLTYTALALILLLAFEPRSAVAVPIAAGLGVAAILAAGFVQAQRRGFGLFERLGRRLGAGWADRSASGAAALHAAIADIYRRRGRVWISFLIHLACWVASTVEAWLALRLAGAGLSFAAVLIIESLLYAVRSIAFAVPNAIGVQEGAYILIGAGFGLAPELALALSLLKRGRDVVIGVPVLAAWQWIESNRLGRRPWRSSWQTKPRSP